ncbi:MAG: ABC transporter substrate-binding protein [Polyangiaceae bacterium]
MSISKASHRPMEFTRAIDPLRSWIALLLCSLAAGCEPESRPPDPGVLVITESEQTASYVRNFNPLLGAGRWASNHAIYEPLLIYNVAQSRYEPWLATKYAWSDDGLELSFTTRGGVKWSDGKPFSAKDAAFTFDLLRRFPALDINGVWKFLERVETPGENQLRLRFKKPFVPGLYYLATQPIVSEHKWRDIEDPVTFSDPDPVGTGPFTEIESFQSQVYQVGKNPNYWQPGKPKLTALRFPAFPANDQTNLALIHGDLDWAGTFVPAIERTFVSRDPDNHRYWFPLMQGSVLLYPNHTRAPLNDVRVRKALSQAIDRKKLVQVALFDYSRPADATGLSDAYATYRDPQAVAEGDWVNYDPEHSGSLLDSAGIKLADDGLRHLPSGATFELEVNVVAGWSDWVRAAQVICRNLEQVGVKATLRSYDFGAWFQKLQRGDFWLSLGWTEEGPTPYSLYRGLMATETKQPLEEEAATNWHRFASPKADAWLAELERTTDPKREHALYASLQRLFVAEAPALPLFPDVSWGEYNLKRFKGFPSEADPYALLTPNKAPDSLLVLTRLEAK